MTKRQYDNNGWLEVKDNPITKVGVFPYLGKEIGAPEPNKIYMVYRPAEELEKPETINSFKLMPFIDEHEMMGKGATPAEKKGIEGVIGENVYFDYPYLRGNIKVLANRAIADIEERKKIELSPGYRCRYDFTPGVFEGDPYVAIQRDITANHMARVIEGRTGPDLCVQDHNIITIDTMELVSMKPEDKDKPTQDEGGFTPEQLAQIKALIVEVTSASPTTDNTPATEPEKDKPTTDDAEEAAEAAVEAAEVATEAAGSGEAAAVEKAEVAIEAAETAVEEAKEELAQATTDSLCRRLKHLRKGIGTMDTISVLKRKVARLEKEKPTMDTGELIKQLAGRDDLAKKVSNFIGTFDSATMTHQQVAEYGVEKLGIKCPKGSETVALDVWMQGRTPASQQPRAAMDSAVGQSSIKEKWGTK